MIPHFWFFSIFITTQEAWYYMAAPKKVAHKDLVRESTTLHATTSVDSDLQKALCDTEQGFMRAGAMPSVTAATSGGCKQILDAVGKALCVKSFFINSNLVLQPKPTKHLSTLNQFHLGPSILCGKLIVPSSHRQPSFSSFSLDRWQSPRRRRRRDPKRPQKKLLRKV